MNKRGLTLGIAATIGIVVVAGIIYSGARCEKSEASAAGPVPETAVPVLAERAGAVYGQRHIAAETDAVSRIVNPADHKTTGRRLQLVHALPDTLSARDRAALEEYLKYGPNSDIEYVIKNDLMNKLRNQKELPPELTGVLLELYSDRGQDMVVRIYALQHLRPQYELTGEAEIVRAFRTALDESENEIAGGALLALRYLATEYPNEFDASEVSLRAAKIAADEKSDVLTRISAIQVASQLKNPEIEPVVRKLAEEENAPLALRLSAVAGLGIESVPLLRTLAERKDPVGNAARAALSRMN